MDAAELRELDPTELLKRLDQAQKELFNLRLRVGQTPNTTKIWQLRTDVARIKTVLSEKGVKV